MLGLVRKKRRPLIIATVVISLVLVQAFFLARLLTSKTPSEDKNNIQFASLLKHIEAAKKPLGNLLLHRESSASEVQKVKSKNRKSSVSDVRLQLPQSYNEGNKPKVNSANSRLSSRVHGEAVGALPQQKASLHHHHLKRHHLDKPVIDPMAHGFGEEVLVETDPRLSPRSLTKSEQAGNNILFTLRTTMKFHKTRLPVLFDTWLTKVNRSNIFLVTDGEDNGLKGRDGKKLFANPPPSHSPSPSQPLIPNWLYS